MTRKYNRKSYLNSTEHVSAMVWMVGIQLTFSRPMSTFVLSPPTKFQFLAHRQESSCCLSSITFSSSYSLPTQQLYRYQRWRYSTTCKYQRLRSMLLYTSSPLPSPSQETDISSHTVFENSTNSRIQSTYSPIIIANEILSLLATQNPNKTRLRLEPMLELASLYSLQHTNNNNNNSIQYHPDKTRSIVDIGCDHGLFTFALASLGYYHQVIGIDISHEALQNGAYRIRDKIQDVIQYSPSQKNNNSFMRFKNNNNNTNNTMTSHTHNNYHDDNNNNNTYSNVNSIDKYPQNCNTSLFNRVIFRYGNGLCPLLPGEGQTICIMGIGVETMLDILSQSYHGPIEESYNDYYYYSRNKNQQQDRLLLNFLGTRYLFLQPTPSRPRNLMHLYQTLDHMGWNLIDEKITFVSSRWYISCAFEKRPTTTRTTDQTNFILPGSVLKQSIDPYIQKEYHKYVQHHLSWIFKDRERSKTSGIMMNPRETMWLHSHLHLKR